jgi:putative ABC transport system permease protein
VASGLPHNRRPNFNDTLIEGYVVKQGAPPQNVDFYNNVGPKYFEAMGIRLIEGRVFNETDGRDSTPVVVVNQTLANMFWPGESAIGRRIKPGIQGFNVDPWRTVVGVVADVKNGGLDRAAGTEVFMPLPQVGVATSVASNIIIRGANDPKSLLTAIRNEVRSVEALSAFSNIRTMDEVLAGARSRPRFLTLLLTLFSGVALVLAALGIYGVISYSVAQRTSEIGIRMAMGAQSGHVLKLVLGQGLLVAGIGTVLGAVGAFALTRFLKGLLFGVSSFDVGTFLLMAGLLIAVTVLACYLPARRASRVDPMIALRYE